MFSAYKSPLFYVAFIILFCSAAYSNPPPNTYSTRVNNSGGASYYSIRGAYLGRSTSNVFNGKNYYTPSGSRYSQTNKSGTNITGRPTSPSTYYHKSSSKSTSKSSSSGSKSSTTSRSSSVSKSSGASKSSSSSKGK